jgi:hypothetical protein
MFLRTLAHPTTKQMELLLAVATILTQKDWQRKLNYFFDMFAFCCFSICGIVSCLPVDRSNILVTQLHVWYHLYHMVCTYHYGGNLLQILVYLHCGKWSEMCSKDTHNQQFSNPNFLDSCLRWLQIMAIHCAIPQEQRLYWGKQWTCRTSKIKASGQARRKSKKGTKCQIQTINKFAICKIQFFKFYW